MTPEELERKLSHSASALRTTLGALIDAYPKAVLDGRIPAWGTAVHSVVTFWESSATALAMEFDKDSESSPFRCSSCGSENAAHKDGCPRDTGARLDVNAVNSSEPK